VQTRDEIISTMEVEQRICKLETLVTLLVEYINRYNINNAVNANHLQLLSLNRDEALHRYRINYEVRNHNNDDNDDDKLAEDEIDGDDSNKAHVAVTTSCCLQNNDVSK